MSEEQNILENEKQPIQELQNEITAQKENILSQPTIPNSQPGATTMEVHHHPHLPHAEKKTFKEYLFEFFMLFLAVSAGFFVENLREHYIEGERAEEYAHTLLKDVIKDTIALHATITTYERNVALTDTLQLLRKTYMSAMPDVSFYYYSQPVLSAFRLSFNDATLQQLKSSGNLRYFRSLKLKEKISEYDNIIRIFSLRQEFELVYASILNEYRNNLFDYDKLQLVREKMSNGLSLDSLKKENSKFLTKDSVMINSFLNFCNTRNAFWKLRMKDNINPTLSVARELIALLKQQYNFAENE